MASRRNDDEHESMRRRSPASNPEEAESRLVSMALQLAEKQIADGTASSQLVTHFAKLGSSRERLEQERLINENQLLKQKVKTLEDAVDVKHLMEDALEAFKGYQGRGRQRHTDDYDD